MATTAAQIIEPAIASSLANDRGVSDLANDTEELLNVLNRKLGQIYALAGMPKWAGGVGKGDFFATSTPVTIAAAPVDLPAAAFRHIFTTATGGRVAVISRADLVDGVAELPPAVLIEQQKVSSPLRAGDPAIGETLTVHYTPLPGALTADSHFIGATLPADEATTRWPSWVGDPFLVAYLAYYLALKAGDRDAGELEALRAELNEAAQLLASVVELDATRLVQTHDVAADAA